MNPDKYERQVTLLCPTCGCTDFEILKGTEEKIDLVRCSSCGRKLSKEEIMNENSENLEEHLNEVGKQVKDDLVKEMQKKLRDAFKGNKHIKFR